MDWKVSRVSREEAVVYDVETLEHLTYMLDIPRAKMIAQAPAALELLEQLLVFCPDALPGSLADAARKIVAATKRDSDAT